VSQQQPVHLPFCNFCSGKRLFAEQLELEFVESISRGLASTHDYKRQKKEAEQRAIQKKHDDYKTWITETMETEDSPSIRLFAVFGNFDS
jgi:tRNA uridine 5-carbamoylmethylation protein Kti12